MSNPEVEEIGPDDDDEGIEAFRPKPKTRASQELMRIGAGSREVRPMVPKTTEEQFRMAQAIHTSHLAPKDLDSPEKILVAIWHGAEIGLLPMQSLQGIAVINGRPSVWGAVAMALVRRSGLLERHKEWIEDKGEIEVDAPDAKGQMRKIKLPERIAHCLIKRIDEDEQDFTFSISEARQAGLWGKNVWASYPDRMLKMRARGFAFRDLFPDVLAGLYLREEAQDFEPIDITPTPAQPETSGLASRLPGTMQSTGFSEAHVEAEMGLKEQLEASIADVDKLVDKL